MRYGKKALTQGIAEGKKPLFFLGMICVPIRRGKRIIKNRQCFLKRNAVFTLVALVFALVPFKVHARRSLSHGRQSRRSFYYITKTVSCQVYEINIPILIPEAKIRGTMPASEPITSSVNAQGLPKKGAHRTAKHSRKFSMLSAMGWLALFPKEYKRLAGGLLLALLGALCLAYFSAVANT